MISHVIGLVCFQSQELTRQQRCKSRNIACIETEERQQQERRASVAQDAYIRNHSLHETSSLCDSTNSAQDIGVANTIAFSGNGPVLNENMSGLQNVDASMDAGSATFDSVFPEFFEHIMMPFAGTGDHVMRPPNVSNYTQDLNFGAADIDFSFLDNPAAWTPMPFQDIQLDPPDTQPNTGRTPSSEAGPRSEALKRSPWSWNSWIPPRGVGAFTEHAELNVREDRVNAADQLTSPSARQISHCSLDQSNRDQMIRIVTQCTVHKL